MISSSFQHSATVKSKYLPLNQAALQAFPQGQNHTLEPLTDFPAIFAAVQSQTVDRGVIPIENSTNGFVVQIFDHFADSKNQHPNIQIISETFVSVQQSLLGRRPSAGGELDLKYIKTLYSHPQAWTQCTPFLTEHLRNTERIDTTSTSRAAELVSQDSTGTSAAICSPLAAELYHLDILVPSIEEKKGNTTRFLILQNSTIPPSVPAAAPAAGVARYKSLLGFKVSHTQPSSLANALAVFGKYSINLTSLNSRPWGERKWNYIFFVEVWGRKGDDVLEEALGEVAKVVQTWKWYGSWVSERVDEG